MRELMSFACDGKWLGASLDRADGRTGVLIVTGGTQTRIGSHRLFERLAKAFAGAGHPCLRFDRRGIGDSQGEDPDFRGNSADIEAAARAFRAQCPQLERIIGLGLCDGATSLSMFGRKAGLSALIIINPWLVEAASGEPPPAAISHHYRKQLLSLGGWKKLLSGSISYRKLFKGLRKIIAKPADNRLASQVAASLAAAALPVELILARGDATAIAAESEWKQPSFLRSIRGLAWNATHLDSDAHTFSRPGDFEVLRDACLAAIRRLELSGSN
jgi:exosortase A-associated hydrolase 1